MGIDFQRLLAIFGLARDLQALSESMPKDVLTDSLKADSQIDQVNAKADLKDSADQNSYLYDMPEDFKKEWQKSQVTHTGESLNTYKKLMAEDQRHLIADNQNNDKNNNINNGLMADIKPVLSPINPHIHLPSRLELENELKNDENDSSQSDNMFSDDEESEENDPNEKNDNKTEITLLKDLKKSIYIKK